MAAAVGRRRHLPLRPHEDPRRDLLHRHAAADGLGPPAPRPRLQLHPHRPRRPLPAHARPRGLLPDGLGRQRPQRRAPRPARHRHDRRPDAPLRPRLPPAGRRPTRRRGRSRSAGRTSSSCARRSSRSSRRSTRSCGRPSGSRSTGTTPTRASARRRRAPASAGSCASSSRGLAYRSESPTLWDVDMRTAVAQAELEDREIPGTYHRLLFAGPDGEPLRDRHDPARAAAGLRRRRRPSRATSATSTCSASGRRRRCFGADGPDPSPRAGRPREGHRPRHGLHLRRHDRRHVVARAAAADARHRPARRPAAPGCARRRRRRRVRRARRQDRQAGADAHRRAARARPGGVEGEPKPITHPVKFWENGTRPLEIVTQPAVVHPLPAQGRAARPRPRAALVARVHAGPLRGLGQRPHRRLEHHPPALLRRPVPGLVPDRRRRRGRLAVADPGVGGRRCPIDPTTVDAARLRRGPARPARRVRRRPRRDGHVGDVVAVAADRLRLGRRPRPVRAHLPDGHAPAGPRDHPHVAVLDRRPQPLRARQRCRGRTPPSPGSSSTPTARSSRSRSATCPTTRSSSSTATAPTPSATGRPRVGRAWTWPSTRAR